MRILVLGLCALGVALSLPRTAGAAFKEDFEMRVFAEAPNLYAKDHSLVQHTDGVYHVFYSVGLADQGWELPGNEIDIGHATSSDLMHWTVQPRILSIDPPNGWKSRNVWAPHVLTSPIVAGSQTWQYLMAYTGVDSSRNQQIGLAVSNDLFSWTDLSIIDGAYRPDTQWAAWNPNATWQNCRDPFILRNGTQYVLLASASTRSGYQGQETRGAIAMATSPDGLTWTDIGRPLIMNDNSDLMASSHMFRSPVTDQWTLFFTRTRDPGGVMVIASTQIDVGFSLANASHFDPTAISSEISPIGAEYLYTRAIDFDTQAGLETRAVIIDSLTWTPGGPQILPFNQFYLNWALFEGAFGALPTYRDRPAFRGGPDSNINGIYWVNTAENDNGPYNQGCPTCGPNETYSGVLRSRPFTLRGSDFELWVGGPISPLCYVALVDSATALPLRTAAGSGSEVLTQRTWDISPLFGRRVYLEIVDRSTTAHVSVDRIEEVGTATVVQPVAPSARLEGLRVSPNPTLGPATLRYELPATSQVDIAIYGPDGRLVRHLAAETQTRGQHALAWDGRTASGELAPTGVYFLKMTVDGATVGEVARLAVVR
jgi:hypothetical protein